MRLGDRRIFEDKEKLYRMVNLRSAGWSITSLALFFGCDIEPISTKCKKYSIVPEGDTYTIERIAFMAIPKDTSKTHWRMSGGGRLCMGRSYADYFPSKLPK